MRYLSMAASLAAAWLLSACGGGGNSAEPGLAVSSTTQSVDTAGGTVALQGLSLTLPAAALTESVQLGVQQETVASPALARFRFSPAGQPLKTPAELRYNAPGLPANVRFFWEVNGEQWMVPGTVSAGTLTSSIATLGFNAAGTSLRAQAASLTARAKAASARALPLSESGGEGVGGGVVVLPVDCDVHITVLKARLVRSATEGDQIRAAAIFNDLQATRDVCASIRIRELEQASCDALAQAQANAEVLIASSLQSFSDLTVPLFASEAFVQNTGATCTHADPAANPGLIEAKFNQLLDVMKGQMARAEFDDALTVRDLGVVMHMETMCQQLDLGAVCDRLSDELYPNLLDALRASAFEECRVNATPLTVSQFYALGSRAGIEGAFFGHGRFSLADVEADLNYCSNPSLHFRVFDGEAVPSELTDRAATLSPLVALGNYLKAQTISVPRDGSLNLSGTVGVLRCPDGSASGADLVVRINGQEWARRAASGETYRLDSAPLLLDLPATMPTVGLDPTTSTGFTVRVHREGGACNDGKQAVLNAPFTLFEVHVDIAKPVEERFELVPKAGGGFYAKTECVRDKRTGLVWEGKPVTGERGANQRFTNYDHSGGLQVQGSFPSFFPVPDFMIDAPTNTVAYAKRVNDMALCGLGGWRVPTGEELMTLFDPTAPEDRFGPPSIVDLAWFPNQTRGTYWTSTLDTSIPFYVESRAKTVHFNTTGLAAAGRGDLLPVRLVR